MSFWYIKKYLQSFLIIAINFNLKGHKSFLLQMISQIDFKTLYPFLYVCVCVCVCVCNIPEYTDKEKTQKN